MHKADGRGQGSLTMLSVGTRAIQISAAREQSSSLKTDTVLYGMYVQNVQNRTQKICTVLFESLILPPAELRKAESAN
jgi:hypothetical protein